MSDVPKEFSSSYYDRKYFADKKGKKFRRPNGSVDYWGYRNLVGWWDGAVPIAKAWKTMFNPRNMLDVGCGRGAFTLAARNEGIEAYGFDFSRYAVNHPCPGCRREWLKIWDATKTPWPYKDESFDLVVCMPGNTPILTKDGWKEINEVKVGDTVLSHKGWCKVTKTWVRHYKGSIIVIKPRYAPVIKLTPEHRMLAVKRRTKYSVGAFFRKGVTEEWVEAKELRPRDFIVLPIPRDVNDVEEIDLLALLGRGNVEKYELYKKALELRGEGFSLYKISDMLGLPVKTVHQWVNRIKMPRGVLLCDGNKLETPRSNPVNRFVKVDEDFMCLMGLYLGDGSTNKNNVMFSYGVGDSAIEETVRLSSKVFGVEATIEENEKSNLTSVVIPSKAVSKFFKIVFEGRSAPEKRMPSWFLYLPEKKQEALIRGLMLSDGYWARGRSIIGTTSETLAKQTWLMLFRLGKLASYHVKNKLYESRIGERVIRERQHSIQISWGGGATYGRIVGNRAYLPIYKVYEEDCDNLVYNLETEDSSYTTISGCVHNCLDFFEHLYLDDIPKVIDELYRVVKKWVFLQIAVVGGGSGPGRHEKGYILKKGEPVPVELEANAAAGHVTVQPASFWFEMLDREDVIPRRDMVEWFYALVPKEYVVNWKQNLVAVMEKLE
jgi:intein/homing endonuclease